MPGGFPISYGQANFNDQGTDLTTSAGTLVTASGSTNTKGSYAQLVASTSYDAVGFEVQMAVPSTGNSFLVDIAVGAAASEVVLVPNIMNDITSAANLAAMAMYVPLAIPAGTRISARCQSSTGSSTIKVSVILNDGSFGESPALGAALNYGSATGTTLGTLIDPGGSANTKGAWVQLTASATYDIGAIQAIFDNEKDAINLTQNWLVDIGVGAAASEIVIIPNLQLGNSGNSIFNTYPPLKRVNIPAGSRIAARCQGTNTTAGTRKIGAQIIAYSL